MEPRSVPEPESLLAHAGWLRALAASLLVDRSQADDVVQDAWVAALQRRPSTARPLAPWLSRVVRNLASKRRRGESRRTDRELRANESNSPLTPAQTAEQLELQRVLLEALLGVEEPLRTTLFLRYFEGRTSAEIGLAQHVPAGTVRWRLKRGLDELRERLDARFGGDRALWCAAFVPLVSREATVVASTASAVSIVGAAAPGVVLMSVAWKVVAAAAVLVAGALWWVLDRGERVVASNVASAPTPSLTNETAPVESSSQQTSVDSSAARRESAAVAESSAQKVAAPPIAIAPTVTTDVDVRFIDAAGAPWSGVRFACVAGIEVSETLSGLDGRARLAFSVEAERFQILSNNWGHEFQASRPGCASVLLRTTLHPGETAHLGDVVLAPGATLHGRVIDESGAPLEGLDVGWTKVELPPDDDGRLHRHGDDKLFEQQLTTKSAADGAFELAGVPAGTWRVWAHATGRRFAWSEPLEVVAATDQFGLELVVPALAREDRIEGRVIDPQGQPVAKARIEFSYFGQHESGSTSFTADDDGHFRIVIYVPGTYCVLAGDPDQRYAKVGAPGLKPGMLDVVVRLTEQHFVDARVRDVEGKPIEGAAVFLGTPDHGVADDPVAPPGERGDPHVSIPMHRFTFVAIAPGFRRTEVGPFDPAAVGTSVDITMQRLPTIRGRVVAAGSPVAGARVELRETARYTFNDFECVMNWEAQTSTKTDNDGRFELGCEIEGDLWLVAQAGGWALGELGPLRPSDATTRDELVLELTHGGAIEGRVLAAAGASGEGAVVGINHGDGRPRTARAGPDGFFRFEGLAPGKWQVLLRDAEMSTNGITISDHYEGDMPDVRWTCDVVAGKTTHYDLDATRR